jgi:hypothetical protein
VEDVSRGCDSVVVDLGCRREADLVEVGMWNRTFLQPKQGGKKLAKAIWMENQTMCDVRTYPNTLRSPNTSNVPLSNALSATLFSTPDPNPFTATKFSMTLMTVPIFSRASSMPTSPLHRRCLFCCLKKNSNPTQNQNPNPSLRRLNPSPSSLVLS